MDKGPRKNNFDKWVARPESSKGVVCHLATPFEDSGRATSAISKTGMLDGNHDSQRTCSGRAQP